MLEWLLEIDRAAFVFINSGLAGSATDFLMPIITNDWLLRIIYGMALILMLILGKNKFIWIVLSSALVLLITDQCSSSLLKPMIERLRPCRVDEVHLLVGCGSGFSFPSSHAANLFGQAMFFGILYKKYRWYLFIFAFMVGISRIFVGVHYPLDVIAGSILGILSGGIIALIIRKLHRKKRLKPEPFLP